MGSLRASAFEAHNQGLSDDSPYLGCLESNGIYKLDELNAVYPIDPRTGLESTDVSKLTDPTLSYMEKERVMVSLQSMPGTYLPSGLSDSEIMSLVPPRYFAYDQVDIEQWREYLGKEILPDMDAKAKNALADEVQLADTAEDNNV